MFGKKVETRPDSEIFTIFDSKIGKYDQPVFAINEHDLVRQVGNMFRDPAQNKNRFVINAEDFSIFKIGSYSKETGSITSHNPTHVANLHEIKASVSPDERLGIVPT